MGRVGLCGKVEDEKCMSSQRAMKYRNVKNKAVAKGGYVRS